MTIEKFSGSFSKEELGVTQITNKTIRLLQCNIEALGFYIYLLSLPSNWEPNCRHLMQELEISKDKVYQLLNYLKNVRLLSCIQIRDSGRFVRNHYTVHYRQFSPRPENPETVDSPFPEKPDAVKPEPVKPETYITNTPKILDPKKTNAAAAAPDLENFKDRAHAHKSESSSSSNFLISEEADGAIISLSNQYPRHTPDDLTLLQWAKYNLDYRIKAPNLDEKISVLKSWIRNGGLKKPIGFGEAKEPTRQSPINEDKYLFQRYFESFIGLQRLGLLPESCQCISFEDWVDAGKPEKHMLKNGT